jgi:ribonuclease HI
MPVGFPSRIDRIQRVVCSPACLGAITEAVMEAAGKDSGDRSSAILIYTDGACFPNPGRGGWGVRIVHSDGTRDELQGSASGSTTSSRMEMTAVLMGLRAVTEADRPVIVRSDSQFVIRTLCGRYRRHKNFDLWKDTDREVARFSRIRFEWVRGHAGDVHNEAADKLANAGAARKLGIRTLLRLLRLRKQHCEKRGGSSSVALRA